MNKNSIMIDPEFRALLTPLAPEEYSQLEENIREDGCLNPIFVWKSKSNYYIVDGHNRYEICKKHRISYTTLDVHFDSRNDVLLWIVNNQLGRRNLTDFNRGELVLKKKKLVASLARERMRSSLHSRSESPAMEIFPQREEGATRDILGAEAGISGRTLNKIEQVLDHGAPELVQAARKEEISIHSAAAIATLPPGEQSLVMAKGKKAVTKKAKEIMEKREQETRKSSDGNTKLLPPCIGMQFARIAVMKLCEIREDDLERTQAFNYVKGWIEEHA